MGLALAIFVPEGIVIASDGLEKIKNSDDGFLQKRQRNLFTYENKFLICIQNKGQANGLPWGYYINTIFHGLRSETFASTLEFASVLRERLSDALPEVGYICYVAGIDQSEEDTFKYTVFMIDSNEIIKVNKGNNGTEVYNYHSIGRSLWINKILLQTSCTQGNSLVKFDGVDIDFSKYSIEDAINFALTLLNVSRKMDEFAQLQQMIGENISIGIIKPFSKIEVKKYQNFG